MNRGLLRILACPVCGGGLKLRGKELICVKCSQRYPIVNGIPYLLPPELLPEKLKRR